MYIIFIYKQPIKILGFKIVNMIKYKINNSKYSIFLLLLFFIIKLLNLKVHLLL